MISASSLLGMNPGSDPFLMTLIAAFALGHITEVSGLVILITHNTPAGLGLTF